MIVRANEAQEGASDVTQPAGLEAPFQRVVGESGETVRPLGVAGAPAVGSARTRRASSTSRALPAKRVRDMTDDLLCGFRGFMSL